MIDRKQMKKASLIVGMAAAGFVTAGTARAATAPEHGASAAFKVKDLGTQVADSHEKGGEGKCGEGKCGEKKGEEGKCGEGKCGDNAKKGAEGKCGEGKCGDKKTEGHE